MSYIPDDVQGIRYSSRIHRLAVRIGELSELQVVQILPIFENLMNVIETFEKWTNKEHSQYLELCDIEEHFRLVEKKGNKVIQKVEEPKS